MTPQHFHARLQVEDGSRLFVEVPGEVMGALGSRKRPPVVVIVNGYRYRSTIAVYSGKSYVGFRREVREAAGLVSGQMVDVTLELDDKPRTVDLPDDLRDALDPDPPARQAFERLSFTHRKAYVDWINEAKHEETRKRRIGLTLDRLQGDGPRRSP